MQGSVAPLPERCALGTLPPPPLAGSGFAPSAFWLRLLPTGLGSKIIQTLCWGVLSSVACPKPLPVVLKALVGQQLPWTHPKHQCRGCSCAQEGMGGQPAPAAADYRSPPLAAAATCSG